MLKNHGPLAKVAKAGAIVLLGAGGIVGAQASLASAAGTGNSVHNCYGIWWNTDWNQECGAGGAAVAGWYHSRADCEAQGDKQIDINRARGNRDSKDGPDCRTKTRSVYTTFG